MADRPGAHRRNHGVSRHTLVMRKAKDEDERRLAGKEGLAPESSDDSSRLSARLTARGAGTQYIERPAVEQSARTSSRRVVVHHEGTTSGRFSTRLVGEQAATVRVAGGDTIIRYESGEMVIRRGTRRAEIRRQVLIAYAVGYFLLFGCYAYYLLTGVATLGPDEFVEKAFALRHSSEVIDLERAAMEAMRGNRTPAEIQMAEQLSFYDEHRDLIRVEKGSRLTLLTAAKLGHAILQDQGRAAGARAFNAPFRIYKDSYLSGVQWPHLLTVYNALGFFLLLGLFLWRPLMHYLGTQAKKTAIALRNSRDAQQEAEDYRDKYRALAGEMEAKSGEMRAETQARTEAERERSLEAARRQAEEIAGGVEGALRDEAAQLAGRIGARAAVAACEQARRILEQRLGQAEHNAAVEELITELAAMDFRNTAGA